MTNDSNYKFKVLARLDDHIQTRPVLAERIYRELLMTLHRRSIASIDSIHDEVHNRLGLAVQNEVSDPNQAERDRLDEPERLLLETITRGYVGIHLSIADVDDVVNLTLKREEVHSLENVANLGSVTFRELSEKVQRFCELPLGETRLAPEEVVGTRVALIRHLVSDELEFLRIAKPHLTIRDFDDITKRVIGSDSGTGRIGGKAGGMILAHRMLAPKFENEHTYLPLAVPESYYLRSDVVEDFLNLNRLDEYRSQKYKNIDDVAREYPLIRGVFRNGDFPLKIVHSLRHILDKMGTHPLIVRSSSLLEDRFGTAFSGKYASVFLANQGTLEHRLRALLGGIAEVFASVMAPDPILYRREHNLIDYVEEMAVLIQKVVGFHMGDYFLPAFAGVAFSRNEYRWSPRIKREDGLMRIVMGLGTRAVDRIGSDYPRMVAMGAPTLRPESNVREILRSSQRTLDVINIKKNKLESIRLSDLLAQGVDMPMLDKIVSIHQDDELFAPTGLGVDAEPAKLCVTFDKLLRSTPLLQQTRDMMDYLEESYGVPVDMEFACDGKNFYVLQCRTQSQSLDSAPVTIPKNIPQKDVVFDAHRHVRTALLEKIEYIVYVNSLAYDAVPTRERRVAIARAIGRVNRALDKINFILIGPGRWGSNDVLLGVPVSYADINHCKLLVEVARLRDGFHPEVSFGTHFFQDLVEANIQYLPLYPDEATNRFNEEFFLQSPNVLEKLLPAEAEFAKEIKVIHVPAIADGRTLTIAMDGETDKALAFLAS